MSSSFRLKDGRACQITTEQIIVGEASWRLADLTLAQMVVDPSELPVPGVMPPPAIAIRGADAAVQVLSPEHPQDAWTALHDLHIARPDLAPPLPPPGYASPGYGFSPYAPVDPNRPRSSSDTVLAGLSHLSIFFAPVIFPLIVWLVTRSSSPFTARHGKQAFVFHLFFALLQAMFIALYFVVVFGGIGLLSSGGFGSSDPGSFPAWIFIGYFAVIGLAIIGGLIQMVFSIIGGIKAFQGERYSYPLLGGL
ncbi:MAG TPA: DUF4870 domain-containing protein [Ktedonobacterales bacterium]